MANKVYIALSLDGFIADKDGGLSWLDIVPDTKETRDNFTNFMNSVDCVIMGRNTFELVVSFEKWIYKRKVFVLSSSMKKVPNGYEDKAEIIKGKPKEIIHTLNNMGYHNVYIDGGKTIQSFLKENLIDEMTLTIIPILLGCGVSLFGGLSKPLEFKLIQTNKLANVVTQSKYEKVKLSH